MVLGLVPDLVGRVEILIQVVHDDVHAGTHWLELYTDILRPITLERLRER